MHGRVFDGMNCFHCSSIYDNPEGLFHSSDHTFGKTIIVQGIIQAL